jgi:phosphatidylinositol glycan class F
MASTTVINANATAKPQPSTAAPIEPLKNDTARLYTHIHPILILSLYAFKFPALVADPVPTLLSTLAPLAVLQIAFVAVCLPPTGGTPTIRKQKPGEKKGKALGKLEQGVNSKIVVCPILPHQPTTAHMRVLWESKLRVNCSLPFYPSSLPPS